MALIHLDAGVLIGLLDADDAHHAAARTAVARAVDGADRLAMAASALAECLVAPARRGGDVVRMVHSSLERLPVEVVVLDVDIATRAARLRARHRSLRLPDALVIATAAAHGADRLVTTHRRWPTAKALGVTMELERL